MSLLRLSKDRCVSLYDVTEVEFYPDGLHEYPGHGQTAATIRFGKRSDGAIGEAVDVLASQVCIGRQFVEISALHYVQLGAMATLGFCDKAELEASGRWSNGDAFLFKDKYAIAIWNEVERQRKEEV